MNKERKEREREKSKERRIVQQIDPKRHCEAVTEGEYVEECQGRAQVSSV